MTTERLHEFRCCDTQWRIRVQGPSASEWMRLGEFVARRLESRLNAFDARSAVAILNETGAVQDPHVARIVTRAMEYRDRTGGVFDFRHGGLEHAIKDYLRGSDATPQDPRRSRPASVHRMGDTVTTDAPLDLNGLAKGYIVDRVHDALAEAGPHFVDGGGDIASPDAPVGIEDPNGKRPVLGVLDTRWNIATSTGRKRRRGDIDHLYDTRTGRIGARHDQVTVLARRDCMEADALATTLILLPLEDALLLAEGWDGLEALWVDGDRLTATSGFEDHVWKA